MLLLRKRLRTRTGPHDPEFEIKSLARKLSTLVTAMANPQPAQKSHFTHAEQHDHDLNAVEWISQLQAMLDHLPVGNQFTKHLHVASLYDSAHFPRFDKNAKEAAEDIRDVSLMRSKSGSHRKIGDMLGGLAWGRRPTQRHRLRPEAKQGGVKGASTEPVVY